MRLAGGDAANRYPWDKPGQPVTTDVAEITRRANVAEGGIGKTSPVSMFPQGASHPFALMDVAGNVWEWTNSWWDEKQGTPGGAGRLLEPRSQVRARGDPQRQQSRQLGRLCRVSPGVPHWFWFLIAGGCFLKRGVWGGSPPARYSPGACHCRSLVYFSYRPGFVTISALANF
ncbi:MAG: SUMF1/EgtB/PvdO family nonheme iron enzyme [Candidatus Promineifilaceae bacterium]